MGAADLPNPDEKKGVSAGTVIYIYIMIMVAPVVVWHKRAVDVSLLICLNCINEPLLKCP